MPSLVDQLSSPAWWITAVVFGVGVNLLSAYLKKHVDTALGKISNAWATRSETLRRERSMTIMFLRYSADNRILATVDILHLRIWTVLFVQVAVGIGVAGAAGLLNFHNENERLIWGFVAVIMVFDAVHSLVEAARRDSELREAVHLLAEAIELKDGVVSGIGDSNHRPKETDSKPSTGA